MQVTKDNTIRQIVSDACTGCSACASICPESCIEMVPDVEGFLHPKINADKCSNCGLCLRTCPVLKTSEPREPLAVYAAINKDDAVRERSSSGGVFWELGKAVIEAGGVVCGAGWSEDLRVIHKVVDDLEGLKDLQGSKYVQSEMGDVFRTVRTHLLGGRQVLFSGTPCQVAGLRSFLGKEEDNLICVDLICHSVSSPRIFDLYKQSISIGRKLLRFQFRDKFKGWSPFYIRADFSGGSVVSDKFIDTFLGKGWALGWFSRNSCYVCRKKFTSGSDFTIADAWGCERFVPNINTNKGVSLVIVLTTKAQQLWDTIEKGGFLYAFPLDKANATEKNPCAWQALEKKDGLNFSQRKRMRFFKKLTGSWDADSEIVLALFSRTIIKKILTRVGNWFEIIKGVSK